MNYAYQKMHQASCDVASDVAIYNNQFKLYSKQPHCKSYINGIQKDKRRLDTEQQPAHVPNLLAEQEAINAG